MGERRRSAALGRWQCGHRGGRAAAPTRVSPVPCAALGTGRAPSCLSLALLAHAPLPAPHRSRAYATPLSSTIVTGTPNSSSARAMDWPVPSGRPSVTTTLKFMPCRGGLGWDGVGWGGVGWGGVGWGGVGWVRWGGVQGACALAAGPSSGAHLLKACTLCGVPSAPTPTERRRPNRLQAPPTCDTARCRSASTTREWPCVSSVDPLRTKRAPSSAIAWRARMEMSAKRFPRWGGVGVGPGAEGRRRQGRGHEKGAQQRQKTACLAAAASRQPSHPPRTSPAAARPPTPR
jgi:hypothetical protein